ncbi:MAG: phenylacetate--CoA ligase [Ignisphaera sp.]
MSYSWIWNPSLESASRKDLEEIQVKRLREQIYRVYNNTSYYHRKMKEVGLKPEDIKSLEDVKKLPFTTKDDLRENHPFGYLVVDYSNIVEIHGTSGTTGESIFMYYTAKDIENWGEVMARSLAAAGLTKNDIIQITPSFSLFTGGFGFFYGARKIGACIVPTGPGFSKRQVYVMMKLGTTMLAGIANYALRLAEVAFELGIDPAKDTKVRKGVFGAEMWSNALRKKIEKIWDMETFDIYGMAELYGPGTAIDCEYHEGLHVWEDHYFVEVVDPKTGELLEPEEKGELVVTTLTKDAVPLIRYRTRDITRIIDIKTCECGRTHKKIDRIQGRTDDMFIINGVNIWPSAIEAVLHSNPLVGNEYQIVALLRESGDKLIVRVESIKKLSEDEKALLEKKVRENLKEVVLVDPVVEVVDPSTLPRSEGKAQRIQVVREYT